MKYRNVLLAFLMPLAGLMNAYAVSLPVEPSSSVSIRDFVHASSGAAISTAAFEQLRDKIAKREGAFRSQKDLVRYIFAKTHTQILRKYDYNARVEQLFTDGSYNCLTGTILYSLLFDHFGISHEVIETNYHIFIIASTEQGQILIDATDPIAGFIDSRKGIEQKIQSYKERESAAANTREGDMSYQFSFNLYHSVSKTGLLGLVYYNLAVESFNNHQIESAIGYLAKASEVYDSARIRELAGILIYSVSQGKIENVAKVEFIRELRMIRNSSMQEVAQH